MGILLISPGHERAHYAFMLAAGAAAIGRKVVIFATNEGCHALAREESQLAGQGRDLDVQTTGVAGLQELRSAAIDLGVTLMVCEAGLRMAGMTKQPLMDGVEIAGIPTFLSAVAYGQIITL